MLFFLNPAGQIPLEEWSNSATRRSGALGDKFYKSKGENENLCSGNSKSENILCPFHKWSELERRTKLFYE